MKEAQYTGQYLGNRHSRAGGNPAAYHWIPVALHALDSASRGSEARNDELYPFIPDLNIQPVLAVDRAPVGSILGVKQTQFILY